MRVGEEGNADTAIRYATTDPERWADTMLYLMDRIDHDTDTECYLWNKSKSNNGYGRADVFLPTTPPSRCRVKAHRLSFALSHGFDALPLGDRENPGDTIDHKCGVRDCVNPHHLQVIPHILNTQLQGQERIAPKGYGTIIASFNPDWVAA